MRKLLILAVLVVSVCSLSLAQPGASSSFFAPYQVYSGYDGASELDTTNAFVLGGAKLASVKFKFTDRFSIDKVAFQYKYPGSSTWNTATDTLAAWASTANGSTVYYEYMIRDGNKNFVPVIQGSGRMIITFHSSGCDTSAYTVSVIRAQ